MATYLYTSRPPGIGCQPDGFDPDTRETWLPARDIDGRHYFGRVEYPETLEPEQVIHYGLRPESELERAELVFWREHSDWLRDDYLSQSVELLEKYRDRGDPKAWAALVIKRHMED